MTDELIFYTNPMSRGRIVRWMLEEVGAPYRTEIVPYGPAMKGPEFRAINPMGKVPALRHGGQTVTETPAICAYLADAFPEAGLAPAAAARGAYYRWLFFAAGPLEAAVSNRQYGVELTPKQQGMVGYGTFATVMDTLSAGVTDALSGGGFISGDRFTAADLYVGAQIGWGLKFGSIEERPGFADYWAKIGDREAWRRATALDDAAMPANAD